MSRRIVFFITGLGLGGAEAQTVRVVERLRGGGRDVRVLTMLDPTAHTDRLDAAGVPWSSLGMRRGRGGPSDLIVTRRVLRDMRPSVLVNFMHHAIVLGRIAGRMAGVPRIISSIRNANLGGVGRRAVLTVTGGLDDVTTTNSRCAAGAFVKKRVVPAGKMVYVPNGIDLDGFGTDVAGSRRRVRAELELAEDEFVWIAVGRLEKQKDYPNLLEAFAGLESKLLVVGAGPDQQDLVERAHRLGLADRVRWLGRRTDVPRLLAAADGMALASAWEGTPNVVIEGQATRLPIVATDVGGVREVVADGRTGFVVPAGNAIAFREAMARLEQFPAMERRAMGEHGRDVVESEYSLTAVVAMWENLMDL